MVCGGEARCLKGRKVGRREIETWDKKKREKRTEKRGGRWQPWQENLRGEKEDKTRKANPGKGCNPIHSIRRERSAYSGLFRPLSIAPKISRSALNNSLKNTGLLPYIHTCQTSHGSPPLRTFIQQDCTRDCKDSEQSSCIL